MDSLVSLTFMEGTILFCFEKCRLILDWLRLSYLRLVLDSIENLIDGEPQQGEVLFHSEGSERIQRENREHLLLEGGLPSIWCWHGSEFHTVSSSSSHRCRS